VKFLKLAKKYVDAERLLYDTVKYRITV